MYITTTYVYSFIAWITILTPRYADSIIAGMVKKGYAVSAVAGNGEVLLAKEGNPSAIITLKITSVAETTSSSSVHKDLMNVMDELKGYYHSVIVAPYNDCCWCGTNIVLNKATPPPLPTVKADKSNLN